MKKFKLVLWIIIIAFMLLVFFQNKAFFISKQSLVLDLYVAKDFRSPEIFHAVWFLAAFVIGLLIAYFFALLEKFRTNKFIKGLKAKMDAQDQMIAQMKQEFGPRSNFPSDEVIDAEAVDVSTPASEKTPAIDR
jgi:uncharacterized integral membrane protein